MTGRYPSGLGIVFVPFIQWGRYLLIVPALMTWGFFLMLGADFAGGGLATALEYLVFAPVMAWYFVEALIDPAMSPSFHDDAWLEGLENDLSRLLLRVAIVGSVLLWGLSAAWGKVRRAPPVIRTARQRFGRVPIMAGGVALVVFLTSMLMPHSRTSSLGAGTYILFSTLLFVVLVITGWWVTFVGVCADGLLARIGEGPQRTEEEVTS